MTSGHRIVRAHPSALHAAAEGRSVPIQCQIFDTSDGLPKGEFTAGRHNRTCARDIDGRLWFATVKGLVMIDPSALTLNDQSPPVHVESVSYFRPAKPASTEAPASGPLPKASRFCAARLLAR